MRRLGITLLRGAQKVWAGAMRDKHEGIRRGMVQEAAMAFKLRRLGCMEEVAIEGGGLSGTVKRVQRAGGAKAREWLQIYEESRQQGMRVQEAVDNAEEGWEGQWRNTVTPADMLKDLRGKAAEGDDEARIRLRGLDMFSFMMSSGNGEGDRKKVGKRKKDRRKALGKTGNGPEEGPTEDERSEARQDRSDTDDEGDEEDELRWGRRHSRKRILESSDDEKGGKRQGGAQAQAVRCAAGRVWRGEQIGDKGVGRALEMAERGSGQGSDEEGEEGWEGDAGECWESAKSDSSEGQTEGLEGEGAADGCGMGVDGTKTRRMEWGRRGGGNVDVGEGASHEASYRGCGDRMAGRGFEESGMETQQGRVGEGGGEGLGGDGTGGDAKSGEPENGGGWNMDWEGVGRDTAKEGVRGVEEDAAVYGGVRTGENVGGVAGIATRGSGGGRKRRGSDGSWKGRGGEGGRRGRRGKWSDRDQGTKGQEEEQGREGRGSEGEERDGDGRRAADRSGGGLGSGHTECKGGDGRTGAGVCAAGHQEGGILGAAGEEGGERSDRSESDGGGRDMGQRGGGGVEADGNERVHPRVGVGIAGLCDVCEAGLDQQGEGVWVQGPHTGAQAAAEEGSDTGEASAESGSGGQGCSEVASLSEVGDEALQGSEMGHRKSRGITGQEAIHAQAEGGVPNSELLRVRSPVQQEDGDMDEREGVGTEGKDGRRQVWGEVSDREEGKEGEVVSPQGDRKGRTQDGQGERQAGDESCGTGGANTRNSGELRERKMRRTESCGGAEGGQPLARLAKERREGGAIDGIGVAHAEVRGNREAGEAAIRRRESMEQRVRGWKLRVTQLVENRRKRDGYVWRPASWEGQEKGGRTMVDTTGGKVEEQRRRRQAGRVMHREARLQERNGGPKGEGQGTTGGAVISKSGNIGDEVREEAARLRGLHRDMWRRWCYRRSRDGGAQHDAGEGLEREEGSGSSDEGPPLKAKAEAVLEQRERAERRGQEWYWPASYAALGPSKRMVNWAVKKKAEDLGETIMAEGHGGATEVELKTVIRRVQLQESWGRRLASPPRVRVRVAERALGVAHAERLRVQEVRRRHWLQGRAAQMGEQGREHRVEGARGGGEEGNGGKARTGDTPAEGGSTPVKSGL